MSRALYAEVAVLPGDLDSLKRQRTIFTFLNLFLLASLLSLHSWFSSFWGRPSASLTALLAASFGLRSLELLWLRWRVVGLKAMTSLTNASIALNLVLAFVLATVVDREDSQYFALLVVPVLEAAFRFPVWPTLTVVALADSIAFYWVWRYFHVHPPVDIGEYFEAGTISIVFLIVGVVISVMVQHLRQKQEQLVKAQQLLLQEEKLAAVGRIASAVAHEIRNPVAMISSSLSTAQTMAGQERDEMVAIAAQEAARMVRLTGELLAYARPRKPMISSGALRDTVHSVADACRAHAAAKSIVIEVDVPDEAMAEYDASLLQQSLMNLVMNAVDASPQGEAVGIAIRCSPGEARITVENGGGPIPPEVVEHLFEPFFTTKAGGTGLGLATARSTAQVQGGDLVLAANGERVRFALILPQRHSPSRSVRTYAAATG